MGISEESGIITRRFYRPATISLQWPRKRPRRPSGLPSRAVGPDYRRQAQDFDGPGGRGIHPPPAAVAQPGVLFSGGGGGFPRPNGGRAGFLAARQSRRGPQGIGAEKLDPKVGAAPFSSAVPGEGANHPCPPRNFRFFHLIPPFSTISRCRGVAERLRRGRSPEIWRAAAATTLCYDRASTQQTNHQAS